MSDELEDLLTDFYDQNPEAFELAIHMMECSECNKEHRKAIQEGEIYDSKKLCFRGRILFSRRIERLEAIMEGLQ